MRDIEPNQAGQGDKPRFSKATGINKVNAINEKYLAYAHEFGVFVLDFIFVFICADFK
jgi:hypothetical protein